MVVVVVGTRMSVSSILRRRFAGGGLKPAPTYFSGKAFRNRSRRSVDRRWANPSESSF